MLGADIRAYEEALDHILAKIFLAKPGKHTVLHETALAREMGMSRTPIRQMLQELALAGLVETRSGVGTVPIELRLPQRAMAFQVFQEIVSAAANCSEGQTIVDEAKIDMVGQSMLVENTKVHDEALYARYTIKISHAMAAIVQDHILAQATISAFWRVIRWRLADYNAAPDEAWLALQGHLKAVTAAMMENDAAKALRVAAGISQKIRKSYDEADQEAVLQPNRA